MKRYLKIKAGFTFLEILATLVILSVALIPILTWVPLGIQTKIKAEQKTVGIFLCQSIIEDLHYKIINDFTVDYNKNNLSFNSPYQDFRYTVTDNLNSNLKTITVEVWHIENPGDEIVFHTQIARR